jgi:hypothetical protein
LVCLGRRIVSNPCAISPRVRLLELEHAPILALEPAYVRVPLP